MACEEPPPAAFGECDPQSEYEEMTCYPTPSSETEFLSSPIRYGFWQFLTSLDNTIYSLALPLSAFVFEIWHALIGAFYCCLALKLTGQVIRSGGDLNRQARLHAESVKHIVGFVCFMLTCACDKRIREPQLAIWGLGMSLLASTLTYVTHLQLMRGCDVMHDGFQNENQNDVLPNPVAPTFASILRIIMDYLECVRVLTLIRIVYLAIRFCITLRTLVN